MKHGSERREARSDRARRRRPRSCVGLLAALTLGCAGEGEAPLEPLPLDLAAPGDFGRFLEELPALAASPAPLRRVLRGQGGEAWRPGYRAVEIRASSGGDHRVAATLHAARPPASDRLRFRCPLGSQASLAWWLFSGSGASDVAALRFETADAAFPVALPPLPARLVAYELDLGSGFCAGDQLDAAVELVASGLPDGLLMSEPQLRVPAGDAPPPPVILISLDTLRADYWDHARRRPPSLESFFRDAVRYRRAFAAAPSTWPAHSVMLSGLYLDQIEERPIWELPSIAGNLRERGYVTQAFVAGGYVRARFGYQVRAGGRRARARPPGFALGFDLYLEGIYDPKAGKRAARPEAASALELERLLEPVRYSLGPALERSLRAWRHDPGVPTFQLIHGYDVHEYRSASRPHWDRALAERVASSADADALRRCIADARLELDAELVTLPFHWDGVREPCRRRVISLLYEARVRSVEDALARYLDALRALGVYERAVIVVTSDHGESLLDESGQWGHSMALANNLHVPLWVKPPGPSGGGGDEDRVTGLVELRGLLQRLTAGAGAEVAGESQAPLRFAAAAGAGLVLADGELCRWLLPDRQLEVFAGGDWHAPSASLARRCELADAEARSALQQVIDPSVPPELEDELRALGYVE